MSRHSERPGVSSARAGRLALGLLATLVVAATSAPPAIADAAPGSLSDQSYTYEDAVIGWPVAPTNEQHPIRASFLDPRPGQVSAGGDPGYHIGIDISVRDDQPETGHPTNRTHRVYAIEGGTASIPSNQADLSCSDRKVTIGHFEYWHTDTVPAISDGQPISPGQFIGWTCKRMWHVHLSERMLVNGQWIYVNPLHGAGGPNGQLKLQPLTDTAPPVVHAIRFSAPAMPTWSIINNAVMSPDAGMELASTRLHGYVDVRSWIDDPQSYMGWFSEHPELYAPLHPYRVRVSVTSQRTSSVVLARDVFRADGILNSAAATPPIPIDYHYAPATEQNLPAVDCENLQPADCKGVYWLRLFATPTGAYWDTTQYPDGDYRIDVTAWDARGNSASSSELVAIANGSASASPDSAITESPDTRTVGRVSCGDMITTDTTLDSDLLDCPSNGIVIGADDITLDLNGHTVSGDGERFKACPEGEFCDVGILNNGHDRVTVRDGSVRRFECGALVDRARENRVLGISSSQNTSVGFLVVRSAQILVRESSGSRNIAPDAGGIGLLESHDVRIVHNTFRRNSGAGIRIEDSNRNRVARNRLSRDGGGIALANARGNLLARNVILDARTSGIYLGLDRPRMSGADNVVSRNVVRRSGKDGFTVRSKAHHSRLKGNIARRSGDDGFDVESRFTKLVRNRAVANHDLGIEAVRGVRDGGGNRASGNEDPRQCVNLSCR
jgi:parallel beta-helix repeat protein